MQDPHQVPEELAEDLVAGRLAERDAEVVSHALLSSEEARGGLAGVLLVHGLLAGRQAEPERALVAIKRRLGAGKRGASLLRRKLFWAAGIAASLLLAAAATLHFVWRQPAAHVGARLARGSPDGLPPGATTIPIGQAVSTSEAPAELACEDGSRVEMAPGSTLTIRGRAGADRWRVDLSRGAVRCSVPGGERPFRVRTEVADVVTEGTRFTVRLGGDDAGPRGLAVTVAEGRVRVEQPGLARASLGAGSLRLFPAPASSAQGAELALGLLFPGERVQGVSSKLDAGVLEVEGRIRGREVEAKLAADGTVQSYSRELSADELPGALPAAVRRAVEAKFGPAVAWLEAEVETRGGVTAYEVEIRAQGKKAKVNLDPDGNLIRKEDDDR